jgi:hypothetical protein
MLDSGAIVKADRCKWRGQKIDGVKSETIEETSALTCYVPCRAGAPSAGREVALCPAPPDAGPCHPTASFSA